MHGVTASLLALGLAMIAAFSPVAAIGIAAIVGTYSVALMRLRGNRRLRGRGDRARLASHVPLLLGFTFALLVARERIGARSPRSTDTSDAPDDVPAQPTGRRRGHLWPINAISTTTRRRLSGSARLRWSIMTASSDDEAVTALALSAARGNERALEAFIKATQHDVWRIVTYLSDAGSADDLTQETFLRAIGAIERFEGRSSARTWLLAIARRVVADHIRHAQSRPAPPRRLPERYLTAWQPRPRIRGPCRSHHDDRRAEHDNGRPCCSPNSSDSRTQTRQRCVAARWAPSDHASPAPAMRCWPMRNATT